MSNEQVDINAESKGCVSVVITCYNDSQVFFRCLDSVLSQTVKPLEIIIIDDCSTDSEQIKKIIDIFHDESIIYLRNETNKNGAFSRNKGMSISKGEYIALLDGDDYWRGEHIEKNLLYINEVNADFVYSNVIEVDTSGNQRIRNVTDISLLENKNDILFYSPPQTNSFFFKKNVYQIVKFDESLRRHQDFQFLISAINSLGIVLAYNPVSTTYYCESHRLNSARVDFDSIFRFWDTHASKFSPNLLNLYLKQQLHSCVAIKKGEGIFGYLNKYEVLQNKELQTSFYIKLINTVGYKNHISRAILYFYYHLVYGKLKLKR